jgi:IS4 transposase
VDKMRTWERGSMEKQRKNYTRKKIEEERSNKKDKKEERAMGMGATVVTNRRMRKKEEEKKIEDKDGDVHKARDLVVLNVKSNSLVRSLLTIKYEFKD